jgi:uncharacterized membrane protein YkvA (DUF1232 family)
MGQAFDNALTLKSRSVSPEARKCPAARPCLFAQVRDFLKNPRHSSKLLYLQLCLLYRILKDPQAHWTAKLTAGLSVGYVLSPVQLIPNFIPIIGQMDDVAAIWLGMKMVRKCAGDTVLAKHIATLKDISS